MRRCETREPGFDSSAEILSARRHIMPSIEGNNVAYGSKEHQMQKPTLIALLAGLISVASFGATQQTTPKIKNVPIQQTSAVSGPEMYTTYCAVCHGATGIGNGPAASALKTQPVNLTLLSKKNGGQFPTNHVNTVLTSGVANPAHGSAEMPIWGDLMMTLHRNPAEVHLRIVNLTNYIKQIQQ
jgi:mono/diheme cytochrome c family protein